MQNVDYTNFDFGERLNGFIQEVMNYGGTPRAESDLTEGQKVFTRAVKREMVNTPTPTATAIRTTCSNKWNPSPAPSVICTIPILIQACVKSATVSTTAGKCFTTRPKNWPPQVGTPNQPGLMSSKPNKPTCLRFLTHNMMFLIKKPGFSGLFY